MPAADAPLAFITGASSGIGQALVTAYRRRGWRVALVGRRVDTMRDWCVAQGFAPGTWQVIAADMREEASVMRAGQVCLDTLGVPDVVIANAGVSSGVDTARAEDIAVLRTLYETNVIGLAATFQPFITPMRERRRGTLVGMASVAGIRGLPGHAAYCGSKAAVIAHCESLRGELRDSGVRVVTLLPGYVATPLTADDPYHKPFEMSADEFAERALRVIDRQRPWRVIPWPMGGVATVLRALPVRVFDRLLAGRPRKPRRRV